MERIARKSRLRAPTFINAWLGAMRDWNEDRMYKASLRSVPDHLRYDVGLDGGVKLPQNQRGQGRSLDHSIDSCMIRHFW